MKQVVLACQIAALSGAGSGVKNSCAPNTRQCRQIVLPVHQVVLGTVLGRLENFGAQLDLFCEFTGYEQRHLTHLSGVNSTHVTCATPLLKAGDYAMKVGAFQGSISVFVEVGPLLMA